MTDDSLSPTDPPPVAGRRGWLAGRSSRREYWIYVALIVALGIVFSRPPAVGLGLTVALVFVQVRRVHDFGRGAGWAVAATLAPLLSLPLAVVLGFETALLVGTAMELALLAWIGAVPGEAGENDFGSPPPFTLRRVLTGR